jgi:hypothetical protein
VGATGGRRREQLVLLVLETLHQGTGTASVARGSAGLGVFLVYFVLCFPGGRKSSTSLCSAKGETGWAVTTARSSALERAETPMPSPRDTSFVSWLRRGLGKAPGWVCLPWETPTLLSQACSPCGQQQLCWGPGQPLGLNFSSTHPPSRAMPAARGTTGSPAVASAGTIGIRSRDGNPGCPNTQHHVGAQK